MTITNHMLSGVLISQFAPLPIAIPIAFASHFLLDALPHFGFRTIHERRKYEKVFKLVNLLDGISGLLITIILLQSENYNALFSAIAAMSPDLTWVYRYVVIEKFGKFNPSKGGKFVHFHKSIQRYERFWGALIEIPLAVTLYALLFNFV